MRRSRRAASASRARYTAVRRGPPRPVGDAHRSTPPDVAADRGAPEAAGGSCLRGDGLAALCAARPCARPARSRPTSCSLTTSTPCRSPHSRRGGCGARLLYDSHEVFAELPVHGRLARRRWLAVERALLPTGGVDVDEQSRPCRGVRRQPRRAGAAGDHQRALAGPRSARRRRPRPARRDGSRPGAAHRCSTSAACIPTARCDDAPRGGATWRTARW